MSQVVVTDDNLREKREKSRAEEAKIDHAGLTKHWQNPDSPTVTHIEKMIGIAVFPIAMFWGFILSLISIGFGAALLIFKALASFFPQRGR